ncbi:hypothetical protein ACLOJK_031917 [Asimina triloba]
MELSHSPLQILPSHLSASERNPGSKPNFNLKVNEPLLARLEQCKDMAQLRQIHAQIITTGLILDPFAVSRLLAFCAFSLHGDLNYALALFSRIEYPNLFAWNAMIRAFSRSNRPEKSVEFYVGMLEAGWEPDSYTFPFLLKSVSHLSACREGQQIHAHVLKFGLESDSFVANSLIRTYAEFGWLGLAQLVYDKMPDGHRNDVSLSCLIAGFVGNDRPKEALDFFKGHDWREVEVDQVTLATVLSACGRTRDLDLGKEIHCYVEEKGTEIGVVLYNSLMNMYFKCGCLEIGRKLFLDMEKKDSVSWNVLISGLAENGCVEEALEMLQKMQVTGVRADEATFLSLISACGHLDFGVVIHDNVRVMGLDLNISICNALIDMYSKLGSVETGRKVFDDMPQRDTTSWNTMISGYAQSGSMDIARYLFGQMPNRDNFSWSTMILGYVRQGQPDEAIKIYKMLLLGCIEPDKVTIISVLSACSHLGLLDEGASVHLYLEKLGMQIDTALGTALIDMYSKCGCLGKAIEVFEIPFERDEFTWTAMISGFGLHGHGKDALNLFYEMQHFGKESARPNSVTFLSMLSACSHAGLIEDGQKIYKSMQKDYGIEPRMEHKGCMVDMLGRAGQLEEAMEFIECLGSEVDVSVWGALLGACRIHQNLKLGEVAFRKILELEPSHNGAHVLMSNIYAEAGCWDLSKKMRRKMSDQEITKEVGRSWIEVNGILHEFTAGDPSDVGSNDH